MATKTPIPERVKKALIEEARRRGLVVTEKRYREFAPHQPTPKQKEFAEATERFVLYGGGAGGGKSDGALNWIGELVEKHPISVLILRKHEKDLTKPGSLQFKAKYEFWGGTRAKSTNNGMLWTFPSGASVQFGGCKSEHDLDKYLGGEYQIILIDESVQWPYEWIDALTDRLRGPKNGAVRPCLRLLSNPGGKSHNEHRQKFVDAEPGGEYRYIHTTYRDNPYLDQEEYRQMLELKIDPVRRAQMIDGDWSAITAGKYCQRDQFKIVPATQVPLMRHHARGWDIGLSGTGDYTVGVLMVKNGGNYFVLDVYRHKANVPVVKEHMIAKMRTDPRGTVHSIDKQTYSLPVVQDLEHNGIIDRTPWNDIVQWERSSRFTNWEDRESRTIKPVLTEVPCTGSKLERASIVFEAINEGRLYLVEAPWNEAFIDEFVNFTNDEDDTDDQIDGAGNASRVLMLLPEREVMANLPPVPGSREDALARAKARSR